MKGGKALCEHEWRAELRQRFWGGQPPKEGQYHAVLVTRMLLARLLVTLLQPAQGEEHPQLPCVDCGCHMYGWWGAQLASHRLEKQQLEHHHAQAPAVRAGGPVHGVARNVSRAYTVTALAQHAVTPSLPNRVPWVWILCLLQRDGRALRLTRE